MHKNKSQIKMEKNKKRFLEALEKTLGIVTSAVEKTGLSRRSHYQWIDKDPEYAEKVEEITNRQKDFVENKLLKAIQEDDIRAIIFYLKSKAKDRGYVERFENNVNLDNVREIKVEYEE